MSNKKNKPFSLHFGTLVSAAIFLAALVFAVVKISTSCSEPEMTATQPSFLFMQTAHSGTLSAKEGDGKRTLTLNDVSPVTVYFSEKPDREAGHESTAEFIAEWSVGEDSFEANPPNAALDIIGADSQSIAIVELMSATYNSAAQTLEYEILILEDETEGNIPQSFDEAALFIDSTHKDYHCDCSSSSSRNCKCRFKYKLGKSETKEFRGYCDDEVFRDVSMGFSGRKKGTSCTAGVYWNNYTSRSCTNWSPIASDEINITVHCKHFDEDIKKTDPVPHS